MASDFPNLRHLRAFRETAERASVSAAAERIHLSQPAVTQAIAGLEATLGVSLFDRRSDGMFVTSLGQVFLARVQRIFEHLEQGSSGPPTPAVDRRKRPIGPGFETKVSASQLRALIAIWDTGSFSLAARKVGISQPSIHRAARELEKLAGVPFFVAGRRGIELTDAAERFAHRVKLAAAELQQGYDEISLSKGQDSSRIVVGSLPLSRTSILPDAMDALLRVNDGVQLRTIDGPYSELLRSLRYGDLDFMIGALRFPEPVEDIEQESLFDDPLAIVAGPDHPLAGQKHITLEKALQYPWIAPPKSTPSGAYLFDTIGIEDMEMSPVRIVSSSLVLVRGLLARGPYLTIMSRHQMSVEHRQGLMVPLDVELPDSARPIGITFRKGWRATPTQQRFLDLIRAAARPQTTQVYTQNL